MPATPWLWSVCVLNPSPQKKCQSEGGRGCFHQKKKTLTILCSCACPGVVLDIREGQIPAPLRLTFFLGGSLPTSPSFLSAPAPPLTLSLNSFRNSSLGSAACSQLDSTSTVACVLFLFFFHFISKVNQVLKASCRIFFMKKLKTKNQRTKNRNSVKSFWTLAF